MATATELAEVRLNTAESEDTEPYTDAYITGLIDGIGSTAGATLSIWRSKAASASKLVNVSEAGASHSFSDLYRSALDMVKYWEGIVAEAATPSNAPRVNTIIRT